MEALAQSLFDEYWKSLNIPPRHQELDPARVDKGVWTRLLNAIESLFTTNPVGMFFIGPVGTGKTSLLWLIMRQYTERMAVKYAADKQIWAGAEEDVRQYQIQDAAYAKEEARKVVGRYFHSRMQVISIQTHGDLIQRLRDSVNDGRLYRGGSLFDEKAILLLDDLGRGYDDKGGWHLSLQDEYFDWRWKNRLPTFFTTNLTKGQLRSWDGWERIVDRLTDPAWIQGYSIGGDSKRSIDFYDKEVKNVVG